MVRNEIIIKVTDDTAGQKQISFKEDFMNRIRYMAAAMMIGMLLLLLTMLAGCASAPEALEGRWSCDETASDGETYTGFYALEVQQNGRFSMYDREAGNPGISGKMKDTGGGEIACSFDTDDFDPPACWGDLEEEDTLQYEASGDDRIKLGHGGVWLTFSRDE